MIQRLKSFLARAEKGEELTVAFLGGSITQGSLASTPETCYAYRVYEWFRKTYPQSAFHYVNGGIGGTNSHYGVSRAVTDVLMYQPDLVIVDFSVNDVTGSEGFDLVPKSISKRETPVFFNVRALGGNMQGWRKDPANNPPRIQIRFSTYENGKFTDITKP